MKTVQALIESKRDKKLGNHRRYNDCGVIKFFYHNTVIFAIDYIKKQIIVDNGGWGTSSTTRAINSYLRNDYTQWLITKENFNIIDKRK